MILNDDQVAAVRDTFGADPLPDDHPAMSELSNAFGAHSFFVHEQGLSIFVDPVDLEEPEGPPKLMLVAAWTDDTKTQLAGVEPVDTGQVLPEGNGAVPDAANG